MPKQQSVPPQTPRDAKFGGHLYMQTNERQNAVIHYVWSANGTLTEVGRVLTGGAGSGGFSPIYLVDRPNDFETANALILTPDRRWLFTTNGGDNSVSSFAVDDDGQLTLLDVEPTGNAVTGKSGTADSLAYAPSTRTLYVLHAFGPDHIRLMAVDDKGKLTLRPERYSVNTDKHTDRVTTSVRLSPDERFLFVGNIFDERPSKNPDGSGKFVIANTTDPDGLVEFPVNADGTLGAPSFHDSRGGVPFYFAFLNSQPDRFLIGEGVGDGIVMSRIETDGSLDVGPLAQINTSNGKPSELCWLQITPDDRLVFTTNFGYSNISSFRIDGTQLTIARDPACPDVPGDGTFKGFNGRVSSGPSDMWMTPDGAYLYQIYGNASKLVGYAIQPDGELDEITSVRIPYNSPQGLAGF